VIERAFGIIKKRFQILKFGCEYSIKTQIKLFPALAVLGNYIRSCEANEFEDEDIEDENEGDSTGQGSGDVTEIQGLLFQPDNKAAAAMRDRIAHQMWRDYQDYLATRA
jgi:hypothetical protein